MKKTFRDYHFFQALDSYEMATTPLDAHLNYYFREHTAIGSKDRKAIAEKIYKMIRFLGLIDYFCPHSHGWEERYAAWQKIHLDQIWQDASIPPHIRVSLPKLFFDLLAGHFGEDEALRIGLASNTTAPLTVRVNLLKTTRNTLFTQWKDHFPVTPTQHSLWGIHFAQKINFHLLEEFKEGLFEVQDEGSQLIADLVEAKPGDQVLDFCAGSGGKSLAFAHKLQGKGQIYLHDLRSHPLIEAKRRLKRAGIENGQILPHDSPHKQTLKGKMDWVLVDAPCSGSGTLRRNPDIKWKFSKESLARLVQEQRTIFAEALTYLSPKGKIIYATCSVLPDENDLQALYFQEKSFLRLQSQPFRSFPTEGGMDGFFGAVFSKLEN